MKKTAEEKLNEIQNIEVDEFSTPCSICCIASENVNSLKLKMTESNIRHIPVMDNNKPVGIVSDRDLHNLSEDSTLTAADLMIADPYFVESGTMLKDVVFHMAEKKLGSALIMGDSNDELLIFTSTDALNALNEVLRGGVI